MGPFGQNCMLGHCCKLGCFCLQEIEFRLKVAFRYGVCCLTPYHLSRSPEEGSFKVASFNGLTKLRLWNSFFFKLSFTYLCSCSGSSLLSGLLFRFRPSGGYSLAAECGLLPAVAAPAAEHGLRCLGFSSCGTRAHPSERERKKQDGQEELGCHGVSMATQPTSQGV